MEVGFGENGGTFC